MKRRTFPAESPLIHGDTILSLCDKTGNWSEPYRKAGYKIVQVDLDLGVDARLWPSLPSAKPRLPKEFLDIRELVGKVYGILAAPVCTAFANSGARWPRTDAELLEGLALVDACIRLDWVLRPVFFALENPVGKLNKWLGEPRMRFQPNTYGDPYTKMTGLWGHFKIPEWRPVAATEGSKMWKKFGGRSAETKAARSETPEGFSSAFYRANP